MQSIILIARRKKIQEAMLETIYHRFQLHPIDAIVFSPTNQSIGIDDIRYLQKQLRLPPLHGTAKAIIIENGKLLTIQAQHALLKVLEEPPPYAIIILIAQKKDVFLETILSRCVIMQQEEPSKKTPPEIPISEILHKKTLSSLLFYAQRLGKDKEETLLWLEQTMEMLHDTAMEHEETFFILSLLQRTHAIIETTTVGPRFALEQLFFSLSDISLFR